MYTASAADDTTNRFIKFLQWKLLLVQASYRDDGGVVSGRILLQVFYLSENVEASITPQEARNETKFCNTSFNQHEYKHTQATFGTYAVPAITKGRPLTIGFVPGSGSYDVSGPFFGSG